MKPIDKNAATPAYLQIYLEVRNLITSGAIPGGARLPSKRALAEDTGTSVITVEHAYDLLIQEGYAEAKERSGYFAAFDFDAADEPIERVTPPPPHRKAIADFPFSVYASCTRKVLADYGERLLIKSPNNGCPELRVAIADYLKRAKGIDVHPMQIVVGAGAEYLYGLCVQLLGRDITYAIEKPSYQTIYRVYRANGVSVEQLKMGKDGILSAELAKATAKVLHVTPFSSYPTGVTATAHKRQEYLSYAVKHSGYIIEDDFNSEFCLNTKPHESLFSISKGERVIYINTFSKSLAPSLRIGYMILPAALLQRYKATIGFYSCTVPTFDQYVLAEFIAAGHFERYLRRVRRKLRKNKSAANEA